MHQFTLGGNNPKQPKKSVYIKDPAWYDEGMKDEEANKQFELDLQKLAFLYGITSFKLETQHFVREYDLVGDTLVLQSEKAIVRALGKTRKIKIGADEQYKTYEEADAANREYWSNYFKERRQRWTPGEVAGERRRQKRYRDKRKQKEQRISRQQ